MIKASDLGTCLVVQWLRICLPVWGCGFNPWSGGVKNHLLRGNHKPGLMQPKIKITQLRCKNTHNYLKSLGQGGFTCIYKYSYVWDFPGGSDDKESACNVGDLGSTPGTGRSPGKRHGHPLQYCCLENSKDRGVHGVANSGTQLSDLAQRMNLGVQFFSGVYFLEQF